MLDDFPDLSGEEKSIIFQQECANYTINVYENDAYRWLMLADVG